MGQHLAKLLYVCALGGCSLIYNPSNLPDKGSMPPDATIADGDPTMLRIDEVKSPPLLEGAGQGGAAPQVLVVYGGHIAQNATITLTTTTQDVVVDLTNISIAEDGNSFAGTVTAAYMDMLDETGDKASPPIPLTITITQEGAPAPVTKEWMLKPLDQITTGGPQAVPPPGKLFSRVELTGAGEMGNMVFPAGGPRVAIRAVGSIMITGEVTANAVNDVAGAGGCNGGAASSDGDCFGGGKSGGGGGGFATSGSHGAANTAGPASGDPLLSAYDTNRGGGGGGGGLAAGGGGGGAIELTAGGDLSVHTIKANGAAGGNSLTQGAGGGSGGAVVLRSGAMLTQSMAVAIDAGAGGTSTAGVLKAGGKGAVGRWRYDASVSTGTPPSGSAAPKRGPMLVRPANPIFEAVKQTFTVTGDPAGSEVDLVVQYADGATATMPVNLGGATSTVTTDLRIGLNVVCVVIADGDFANEEAKNCIEVAFVP